MKIRNKSVVTMMAFASSIALATLVAAPANADALPITFQADTTTIIAKTGQPVVFPTTDLATAVDPIAGTVTGTLELPQASADLKLGPATLATFTISIIDASPVSGTIAPSGPEGAVQLDLDVQQRFKIRIDSVTPLGIDTGSAGSSSLNLIPAGGNCVTAETTANLTGALDAAELLGNNTADTHIKGTYTIPPFQNCGLLTPVLTGIISGPGNTLDVHVTDPIFDVGTQSALTAKFAQ